MAVEIPYVREIEFEYGEADQVTPLIRRVVANNPSAFTYTGTGARRGADESARRRDAHSHPHHTYA